MRLFADQDVYARTVALLRNLGHDVETARDAGLSTAPDEEIVEHCRRETRALVTRDRDFGTLIFVRGLKCPGVVLVRAAPLLLDPAHAQLRAALAGRTALEGLFRD